MCLKSVFVYLRVALIDSDGTKLNAQMHISKNLLQDPELMQDVKAAHVLLATKWHNFQDIGVEELALAVFSNEISTQLQLPTVSRNSGPTQLSG